jgi:hypothetical protein
VAFADEDANEDAPVVSQRLCGSHSRSPSACCFTVR